ncbi:MAG: hypothetical protein ACLP2F_05550 [Steroidobacteraceae bacterium]
MIHAMKKYQTWLLCTILGSLAACSPAAPGSSALAAAGPPAQDAGFAKYAYAHAKADEYS